MQSNGKSGPIHIKCVKITIFQQAFCDDLNTFGKKRYWQFKNFIDENYNQTPLQEK